MPPQMPERKIPLLGFIQDKLTVRAEQKQLVVQAEELADELWDGYCSGEIPGDDVQKISRGYFQAGVDTVIFSDRLVHRMLRWIISGN